MAWPCTLSLARHVYLYPPNAIDEYTDIGVLAFQGLPRNGGEKNYLEFIFRKPKLLVTCVYAMYAVCTVSIPCGLHRSRAADGGLPR